MPTKDPRIDAYISKSADFARPILQHLRRIVHAACPEVEETMKWRMPCFVHRGILCNMAAFKQHCSFGFWKGDLIFDPGAVQDEAHGQFGRLTALSDLPKKEVLAGYVKKAAELNEAGIKLPARGRPGKKKELVIPEDFMAVLKKNRQALAAFENFSPSHRREYVEWIAEAKREETRAKRLATALDWLSQGKPRHWKYADC